MNGYTTDRFASDIKITVPAGFTVLGSGLDSHQTAGDKTVYEFRFERQSFPGSIAVVKGDPVKVQEEGVTTSLYFRGAEADMAQAYGQEIGKQMSYFTGTFGLPPSANLTVVETEAGAPNGYAAPGLVFLAPHAITRPVSRKTAGQRGIAPVVGRAGFTYHPQPSLADQRPGGLFRAAVDRSTPSARPPWKRSSAT